MIQSGTKAQLSAERPFSGRMEAPGQLPGNLIQSRTKAQLSAKKPFSGRMEAAILWENGGTWSVTKKLIQSRIKAQLSVERPFSKRMEEASQLLGN